jgi:hypothetical protein
MTMSKELLEVVQRVTTDAEYRAEFMADPKTRLSELGVPANLVERIVPTLLAAVAAGSIVLTEIDPEVILSPALGWR